MPKSPVGRKYTPKLTAPPRTRKSRSVRIGETAGGSTVPVAWSTLGTVHRGHGYSVMSCVACAPKLIAHHVSSSKGAQPLTTTLGRKRSMGTGGSDAARRRAVSLGIRVDAAATARDDARDGARTLDATRGNFRRARVALERACAEVSAREAVELARARALGAMATTTAVRGKTRASGDATNAAGEEEARKTEEKSTRVSRRA